MASHTYRKKTLPLLIKAGIGLGTGLLVILLTQGYLFRIPFLDEIEHLTTDMRFNSRYEQQGPLKDLMRQGDVVIVGISDKDLIALPEKFPFPRSYYAHVIENLNRAGARAIGIDITFENPGVGDSALYAVLSKYDNVVLAAKAQPEESRGRFEMIKLDQNFNNIFFEVNRKRIGIVNVIKDRDDVVRRYTPLYDVYGTAVPSLAFALMNRVDRLPPLEIVDFTSSDDYFLLRNRQIPRFDPRSFHLNYYGPNGTFRYVPFSEVIDDATFQTKDELDLEEEINLFDARTAALFKNKVVIIGSTMPEERDYHKTPIANPQDPDLRTDMNGVEIHATAVQNILDNSFVIRANPVLESLLILLLSVGVFFGLFALRSLKFRHVWLLEIGAAVIVLLIMGGLLELSILVFTSSNVLLGVVNPSLAAVLAYVATIVYTYLTERQQKALIKNVFSHYISPAVVNELVANPEKAKLGGDKRELTVFFSDIASFTSISESLTPEALVELLNEYLDEMTEIIIKYNGTLDKYEGDAIMAFWGAPIPQRDHALRACLTALEMQKRLLMLHPKWKKEGKPLLEVRIGLNTGSMIAGNMGGRKRFDYTVIGDSVNLASRLEGANKQYRSKIMVSEFTYQHVRNKLLVRELDLIQVKGKTEPVKVYELLGTIDMEMKEEERQSLELYHEGLQLYRQKKFEEAIAYMQQAYSLDEKCFSAQIYMQRANLYMLNPPPEDWNGVFVMTTK